MLSLKKHRDNFIFYVLLLSDDCEILTVKQRDLRLKAEVMKFTRYRTQFITLRRHENTSELYVDPVEKKLAHYKQKWLNILNKCTYRIL
jgi:hypothetical protein